MKTGHVIRTGALAILAITTYFAPQAAFAQSAPTLSSSQLCVVNSRRCAVPGQLFRFSMAETIEFTAAFSDANSNLATIESYIRCSQVPGGPILTGPVVAAEAIRPIENVNFTSGFANLSLLGVPFRTTTFSLGAKATDSTGLEVNVEYLLEITSAPASTSGWRNPVNALDVNNSGSVTSRDALTIINDLNRNGGRALNGNATDFSPVVYLDVNGDGWISSADALLVINRLNVPQ